jgi:ABC-type multidrug transport system fused ATPase/permease subunit
MAFSFSTIWLRDHLGLRLLWSVAEGAARKRALLVASFVLPLSILRATSPLALREAINHMAKSQVGEAALAIAAYAGCLGAARLFNSWMVFSYGEFWRQLYKSLLGHIYDHLIRIPSGYYVNKPTGRLSRTVWDGIRGARSITNALLFGVAPSFLQLLLIGGLVIFVGQFPALTILALFGIGYGFIFVFGLRHQMPIQRDATRLDAEVAGYLSDAFMNQEAIKLFCAEDFMADRIGSVLTDSITLWKKLSLLQNKNNTLIGVFFIIIFGAALFLELWQFQHGLVTLGDFVMINAYLFQLINPVEAIGLSSREIAQSVTHVERLNDLLAENAEHSSQDSTAEIEGSGPLALCVKDLHFSYGDAPPLLRDIAFEADAGQMIAIVGPTGSGKSTLVRLILRLHEPDAGEIYINGHPLSSISLRALRESISVVPQDTTLINGTLRENIALGFKDVTSEQLARGSITTPRATQSRSSCPMAAACGSAAASI